MSSEIDDFKKMIEELKQNGFKEVEVETFDSLKNIKEHKNEINKGTGNSRTQKNVDVDFKTDYEGLCKR